jgi:N-methylhydantoinase B
VKVYEQGVERRDVVYLLAINNRTPTFIGDLRSQIGAAQLGARRLEEIALRTAPKRCAAVEHSIDYARRRFREEVAAWPDGTYTSDVYVDHDPKGNCDVHVHCAVTVRGDHLTVDFTGSDTRPELQPGPLSATRAATCGAARVDDGPRDPEERGILRGDRADRARGLLPESDRRRSVAAGTHHPGVEVGEASVSRLPA